MKFDVVVGLQYGSEAKGLVCNALSKEIKYDACVSVFLSVWSYFL